MVVDELPIVPCSYDALELGREVGLGRRVWLFACKRAVEVVYAAEVIAVLAGDYCELIRRMSGIWVYLCGQVVVTFGWAPIAVLVLLDEFGFAVAGKVAELDERLVARDEDLRFQVRGDALARGGLGGCSLISKVAWRTPGVLTIILPFLGDFAQLWDAVELSVEVQYVLAVEALAGLDKLQIGLLELADLDNMVLGSLELPGVSDASRAFSCGDAPAYVPA